jgi:hypothetical protein
MKVVYIVIKRVLNFVSLRSPILWFRRGRVDKTQTRNQPTSGHSRINTTVPPPPKEDKYYPIYY